LLGLIAEVLMPSLTLLVLVTVTGAPLVSHQNPVAPPTQLLAAKLVERLGTAEPKALAAAVPGDESRFVAVLHVPGNQLLAVSAIYSAPSLLRERILKHEHHDAYLDLNSAGDLERRFFVFDLAEPGLTMMRRGANAFDITWRNGVTRTLYDGDWQQQGLSEDEYRERFETDEAEYANLLRILLATEPAEPTRQ
jgi:hypothetical protein